MLVLPALAMVACMAEPPTPSDEPYSAEPAASPAEEIGQTSQAVFGNVTTSSNCTADMKPTLRNIMIIGRQLAQSNAFAQCLDRAIRGGAYDPSLASGVNRYLPCGGLNPDPFQNDSVSTRVSKALAVTRATNDLNVSCTGGPWKAEVGDYEYEKDWIQGDIRIVRTNFDQEKYADDAGSVWHEVMHQWGYKHDGTEDNSCIGQPELIDSMPYVVENCMEATSGFSETACANAVCGGPATPLIAEYPTGPGQNPGCLCYRDTTRHAPVLGDPNVGEATYGQAFAVGDFDGDKFKDLAIGAPSEGGNIGAVYVYRGSEFGLQPWKVFRALNRGDRYGAALAAGDLNGDGRDELAIGAPNSQIVPGYVVVLRGDATNALAYGSTVTQTGLEVNEREDEFGAALAIGKVFGTGRSGLVVGAPGEIVNGRNRGAVFVYEGVTTSQLVVPRYQFTPLELTTDNNISPARFGESLALGDFNADGAEAMLIGAPGHQGVGRVFWFPETGPGATSAGFPGLAFSHPAPQPGMRFGHALAVAWVGGEVEQLIAVGSPGANDWRGMVTAHALFEFSNFQVGRVLATFEGSAAGDQLGRSLVTMKVNGADRLAIGAPLEAGSGRVHTVLHASDDSMFGGTVHHLGLSLDPMDDHFGAALAAGDFDYDGNQELIVGAPYETPANLPRAGAAVRYVPAAEGELRATHVYHKHD